MKNTEVDPLFHEYAVLLIDKLVSDELSSTFSEYIHFLGDRIQSIADWRIAVPVIACQAAGGSFEHGITLASAWVSLFLASEILDNVEDQELASDQFLISPKVVSNLATGVIFSAFHTLTSIQDAGKVGQIVRLSSGSGFDAVNGQHQDLLQTQLPVESSLDNYWGIVILKSGSVFHAGIKNEDITEALGDCGVALGVILQLMDDFRDAFNRSEEAIRWEVSLPLLLYLMTVGEENINFPKVSSHAEWSELLQKTGVIQAISTLFLQWKSRALDSLSPLPESQGKFILDGIPSIILE